MSSKRRRIYYVVNEGNVVYASYSEVAAENKAEDLRLECLKHIVEEAGRDIDDLTPGELIEFEIYSGANGGYHYVGSIKEPKPDSTELVFRTDEGDDILYDDLMDCLDDSDEFDEEW